MTKEQNKVIRSMLVMSVYLVCQGNGTNKYIDSVLKEYERFKADDSIEASNRLGVAIHGEEWSLV